MTQKIAKNSPSAHHRTTLSSYIFATKHVSTIGKKLLNSNMFSACSNNMVNFGQRLRSIGEFGVPSKFQLVSRFGFATAATSTSLNGSE